MTDDHERLLPALERFVYETTHLSAQEDDGSHVCKISRECLDAGRAAIQAARATQPALGQHPAWMLCDVCGEKWVATPYTKHDCPVGKERGVLADTAPPSAQQGPEQPVAAVPVPGVTEDFEKMRAFIDALLEDWPDRADIDGCELQDLAEKHGILIPEKRTEYCKTDEEMMATEVSICSCADNGAKDDGEWTCFRRAEFLRGRNKP